MLHRICSKWHFQMYGTLFLYANSTWTHLLERKDGTLICHILPDFLPCSSRQFVAPANGNSVISELWLTVTKLLYIWTDRPQREDPTSAMCVLVSLDFCLDQFVGYSLLILQRHTSIVNSVPVLCWTLSNRLLVSGDHNTNAFSILKSESAFGILN
jgi:hypothetical protein